MNKLDSTSKTLLSLSACEAAAAIRNGDFTAERYVTALLRQAERTKELDFFISRNEEDLREAARMLDLSRTEGRVLGEFAGIPLLIKDNIETTALPTTAGTPSLRSNRPSSNAEALQRLLQADGLIFGKTNMHELAMGPTSNNLEFGAVHNPYDTERIPGGSSGGTAAAVAAHVSPAGLGTDTTGSGRIPASLCGVVGYRPSPLRYPAGGVVPVSHTRDVLAPITRTVEDADLMDRLMAQRPATKAVSPKGIKLGVSRAYFWDNLASGVEAVLSQTTTLLREAGCKFVEIELPGLEDLLQKTAPILAFEAIHDLRDYLAKAGTSLTLEDVLAEVKGPDVASFYQTFLASGMDREVYQNALLVQRPKLQAHFAEMFRGTGVDALYFPSTPITAPRIGETTIQLNGTSAQVITTLARNTNPASAAGLPAISIPAGLTGDGLPIGLELLGQADAGTHLLALGMAVQHSLPALPAPSKFV